MIDIPQSEIIRLRESRYRRTPERCIQSIDQARAWLDEIGFCHFWPIKGVETPNLFHAIAGRERSVPNAHNDPDLSTCWSWKDRSLDKRWWYYGKLLRRRATLVSLDLLPAFYACSENFGDLDDYLEEYRAGTMTAEAKQIYEAILKHGPLDTIRLRRESAMRTEGAKARFERGLTELQTGLKVLPIGVARAGAWNYAFTYEIVQRHYPDLPGQARHIKRSEARCALVQQYVDNVIAADRRMIQRVFHVLHWTKAELDRTLEQLNGRIVEANIEGQDQPQFVSARALQNSAC